MGCREGCALSLWSKLDRIEDFGQICEELRGGSGDGCVDKITSFASELEVWLRLSERFYFRSRKC